MTTFINKQLREDYAAKTIYVSELPPTITENELRDYFERKFGKTLFVHLKQGFSFVKFVEASSARAALNYSHHVLDKREIRVKAFEYMWIDLKGVPSKCTPDEIQSALSKYGIVKRVVIDPKKYGDTVKITFASSASAEKCLKAGRLFLRNSEVKIEPPPLRAPKIYQNRNVSSNQEESDIRNSRAQQDSTLYNRTALSSSSGGNRLIRTQNSASWSATRTEQKPSTSSQSPRQTRTLHDTPGNNNTIPANDDPGRQLRRLAEEFQTIRSIISVIGMLIAFFAWLWGLLTQRTRVGYNSSKFWHPR